MALEYITYEEVLIHCRSQELPLLDDDSDFNKPLIDLIIKYPRNQIEKVLKASGYITPLITKEQTEKLDYITVPFFRYYITQNNGLRTEQIKEDYLEAKTNLSRIGAGKDILDLPTISDPDGDSGAAGEKDLMTTTLDVW